MSNNSPFKSLLPLLAVALLFIAALFVSLTAVYQIDPTQRGVKVTLGKLHPHVLEPGIGFKWPFITDIIKVNVQQTTKPVTAECFSSDLQQVNVQLKVLYRIPEQSVIPLYSGYRGDVFESLVLPRVQEATKEVTALRSAADIVKTREQVKIQALESARKKVSNLIQIEDLVIENVSLSRELEAAIESKMVQQQEAERAVFKKQQAQIDADTAVITAKGQAEAIRIQGEALEKNPRLVELKMVEKWDGKTPQVVGPGSNILLPLKDK